MSTACTDDACTEDDAIKKCTESGNTACYTYLFVYESTTMTQLGCTANGFTSTVPRSYGPTGRSTNIVTQIVTTSRDAGFTLPNPADVPISTYTQTAYIVTSLPGSGVNSVSLGAIIGGAVGGFAALSITGFGIFFVRRKIKKDKARQAAVPAEEHVIDEKVGKGDVVYKQVAQSELPEQSVAEMSQPPQELDGSSVKHETSASPIGEWRPLNGRRASF